MAFDVQGARQAGYSDAEIADYIAADSNFDTRGARSAGYSDTEILDHLLTIEQPAPAQVRPEQAALLPTKPETDEERVQRYRESDAAGAPMAAPMTQQDVDQWGETIRDIPTQVRAAAAQTVAGMRAREFAELEGAPSLYKGDRGKSQEQIDAERRERTQGELAVAREAGDDLADIGAKDRTLGQRAVGGAATSLVQTALPMAAGIVTRSPVVAAATMQPTTAGQTFAELANEYEDQRNAPPEAVPGQVEAGNIDLAQRPVVKNPDGTISTVRSMSFEENGKEVLVPTISEDGRTLTNQEAIEQYRKTGRHLGKFADPQSATEYAEALHQQQSRAYSPEARTADLKRAGLHGDVQGILETGTELLPFAKLFKRGTQPMNRLVEFLVQEIPGESVATVTQAIDDVIARSPPGVTVDEVLQGLQQGFEQLPETWATTLLAGGAQAGTVSLVDAAARRGQKGAEEADATFESVPDVPRLPERSQINVDSGGVARTTEDQRQEQEAQAAELQRQRDLGLDEVRRVVQPQEEVAAAEPAQPSAPPTQNVELYQYQRTAKDLRGRQAEVRELTEEDFQRYIRPVLSDGVASTLEEYHAKFPSATHVRFERTPKGVVLEQVGESATIRPSGPDVRRVESFDAPDVKQFAITRAGQERVDPNRVNPEKDSVLTAISKLGGLSREEAVALGIEPKHLTHRGHGINLSFRRTGKKFTEMAQALQELGYAITDQSALHEAINQELGGSKAIAGAKPAQPAEVKRDEHETVRPVQGATPAEEAAPAVQVPAVEHRPQQAARPQDAAQPAGTGGTGSDAVARPADRLTADAAASAIDTAAHAAATSPTNELPDPTDAQKEAGNYKKGHLRVHGLDISIENPAGSTRRSKADAANKWEVTMPVHYGYIRGTTGADDEHFDVFIGSHAAEDGPAWVIDQATPDGSRFDESKAFVGFFDSTEAVQAYAKSFAGDFGQKMLKNALGWRSFDSVGAFREWLSSADLKKPASVDIHKKTQKDAPEPAQAADIQKSTADDRKAARKEWAAELGFQKGGDVEITKKIGYLTPGPYKVDAISKTRVYFKDPKTGAGTDLQRYEIDRGLKDGTIRIKGAEDSAPVKTPDSTGEKPKPQVSANKVFTHEAAEKARALLRSKLGQANAGLDPEIMQAGITLAGYHIEKGARTFAAYSKAMLGDLGEIVRPYLKSWYLAVRFDPRAFAFVKDMDTAADVEAAPETSAQPVGESFLGALQGDGIKTITDARRIYAEATGQKAEGVELKRVDEELELAVVRAAREIVARGESPAQVFDALVELYGKQPKLSTRTSTSIENQAYSTPAPLAYLASRLAGITQQTLVDEPTAGNGMLLIAANPERARVNELNPERAANLRTQGFKVTEKDAANEYPVDLRTKADIVIANPPFGVVKDDRGANNEFTVVLPDGTKYVTTEIDHAIAFRALDGMKRDGAAVLIVGGLNKLFKSQAARSDGYNGLQKRRFFYYLHQNYNVVDHFTVAGELYERQGAGWPVDVIVIRGRGKSARPLPAVQVPELYSDWNALKSLLESTHERANDRLVAGNAPEQDSARRGAVQPGTGDGSTSVPQPARGPDSADGGRVGRSERSGDGVRERADRAGPVDRGRADSDGGSGQPTRVEQSSRPRETGVVGAAAKPQGQPAEGNVERASADRRGQGEPAQQTAGLGGTADVSVGQSPYAPTSKAEAIGTLVPTNMQTAVRDALAALEDSVGPLDEFVAKELGYDPKHIGDYFSAEQIDALALALSQFKEGKGFIIGDQTGVGKGRVVAGVIRWTLRNGMTPIFVTERANLYADMFRDLTDIGQPDIRPLMTNGGETIMLDDEGKHFLKTSGSSKHNGDLAKMAASLDLGEFNMVFTTYSQMQTVKGERTVRMDFIDAFAQNGILIMDESHNAGGNDSGRKSRKRTEDSGTLKGGRADFARKLVSLSKGVFYSSATYAKRPSVMDLYYKTDMVLAVEGNPEKLPDAISAGGVPLQQVVAAMLTKAGQYIRRERSFAGVEYATPAVHVDRAAAESIASVMLSIKEFDSLKAAAVEALKDEAKAEAARVTVDGSTGSAGAESTNFTSIMRNLIDQMLLGLKANEAADMALAALKAGEKPVITVSNTMGSFIGEYADDVGLKPGDPIALTFKDLLQRYLARSRDVTIKNVSGQRFRRQLTDQELGPLALRFFESVKKDIERATGLEKVPISPIDWMHFRIREAGYSSDEITGRNQVVEYHKDTPAVYRNRPASATSPNGRRKVIAAFNGGTVDAVILNQAGSTGLSLHASTKFKNHSRRHMVLAQAEKNIDTHMQMLGRVHRTGQVIAPRYSQMVADVPAEKRPAAVLAKKMASLNANTTASRSSQFTAKESIDFLNEYGDKAVAALMADLDDVHRLLGEPLSRAESGDGYEIEDAARKVTGRIPMLPVSKQEELYDMIETTYREEVARADALGENVLEAKTLELDATLVSRVQLFEGHGESPFAAPAYAETVDVKRLGKPYTSEQLRELVAEHVSMPKDTPLRDLQTAGRRQQADRLRQTLAAFDAYRLHMEQSLIEAGADDRVKQGKLGMLDGQRDIWQSLMRNIYPGAMFRLALTDGSLIHGVVTEIRQKKGVKLPVATGSWLVTFAVADGMRSISFPLSRLALANVGDAVLAEGKVRLYAVYHDSMKTPMEQLFDEGQTQTREERVMITGNLLAGFSQVKRGQITHYTTSDGRVQQGILMPRSFSMEDFAESQPVMLTDAQVLAFLEKVATGMVETSDGAVKIVNSGYKQFAISTPRSKGEGGRYFLHAGLRKAVGGDFVSTSTSMRALVGKDELKAALRVLRQDMEQQLLTNTYKDEAKSVGGTSAIALKKAPVQASPAKPEPDDGDGIAMNIRDDNETDETRLQAFRAKHSRASLQAHFDAIAQRWTSVGNLRVVVVDSEQELPRRLRDKIVERGAVGQILGLMDSRENVAYLFRGNVISLDELETTLFHEVEGHLSIRQFFGDEIVPFLNRVAMVDPAGVKAVGIKNGFYNEDGTPNGGNERLSRLLSADEYIAELAQRVNTEQRPSIRKLWDYLVSHFAEWARAIGWKTLKPTAAEIRGWLIRAQRNLRGKPGDTSRAFSSSASMMDAAAERGAATDAPLKVRTGSRATWDAGEPSRLDNLVYTLQDKHIDMKRVQEAIKGAGRDIADPSDPYLKEELFHGRVATRLQRFLDDELKPFLQRVKLAGLTLEELEHYLHARHAPERNAQIATINPDMPDGGSGMTNADADAYMNGLDAAKRQRFEQLATIVDKMTKRTRQTLVGYGLESEGTVERWASAYQHYVPLHREDMDAGPGGGQGFSIRGPSTKRAMGSERRVVNIIANIAMQRERALTRGEKNRVANALVGLARANPNTDFWKVDRPPMIRYVDPRTNLVTETVDPAYKSRDNVVVARTPDEDGKIIEHAVVFNPHDERATRMAASIKNLDMDDLGRFLSLAAKVTRYFAAISTQYNPIFGVINLIRDVQGALLNLTTTHLDGQQRTILRDTISAVRGIYIDAREVRAGRHPMSSWAQLWEEFQLVGGQTGYRDMFRTGDERGKAIQAELKQMSEGKALATFHHVRDWLSDFNLAMENAVRLAVYKAGKENQHLSNERAASIAKNISVNFNRKGQVTTQVGALYAFFNASTQGTARLLETLAGPKGRKIIYGGLLLGAAQALMLAATGFDDDEPKEFIKERNLIIPLPGTDRKYLMVPYPLGFHVLPNLGRHATEFAIRGFRDPLKRVTTLLSTFAEAFNPLGNAGLSLQTIAPTAVDPLAALAENKDWTGKPIAREDRSTLDPTPGHARAKASASDFSMVTSRIINELTGGSEYVPGLLSPTPDQLDYLFGQATGGLGREIGKAADATEDLLSESLPPAYKVPLLGRLYGDAADTTSYSNRFYELVKRANMHKAEIQGRAKHGGDYIAYLHDNPEARSAPAVVEAADLVSKMRSARHQAESAGDKETAKKIETAIASVMRDVVEAGREARKSATP